MVMEMAAEKKKAIILKLQKWQVDFLKERAAYCMTTLTVIIKDALYAMYPEIKHVKKRGKP
jgi:hypothetical protein